MNHSIKSVHYEVVIPLKSGDVHSGRFSDEKLAQIAANLLEAQYFVYFGIDVRPHVEKVEEYPSYALN